MLPRKQRGLLIALCLIGDMAIGASKCGTALGETGHTDPLIKWRESMTHMNHNGAAATTSQGRERTIKNQRQFMEDYIFSAKDTPEMEFYPAQGTKTKIIRTYHNDTIPSIEVSSLGSARELHGTMLLPVSGHVGTENALRWAKTDTYDIFLEGSRGKTPIVSQAKSLGLITAQEVILKLKKGELLRLTYYRSGSGGPSGYPSGRILEILWDGT